jgi:hypothetical protein
MCIYKGENKIGGEGGILSLYSVGRVQVDDLEVALEIQVEVRLQSPSLSPTL